MQHYLSLFLRHGLASPLNHSHFLPYHCYHKSSGNAFSLVLVHSICVFFLSSAQHAEKRGGGRCNNQRMLYRTEKQPMNFFFLCKVQEIHYINFDSPTEFKRLALSLASSWRPRSENFRCCFCHLERLPIGLEGGPLTVSWVTLVLKPFWTTRMKATGSRWR